jgi:hypothetical protein
MIFVLKLFSESIEVKINIIFWFFYNPNSFFTFSLKRVLKVSLCEESSKLKNFHSLPVVSSAIAINLETRFTLMLLRLGSKTTSLALLFSFSQLTFLEAESELSLFSKK